MQQILRSSAVEWRVIHALLLREMLTRFGRHNIGFLWLFVEPMLFTLGVTTLWTLTKSVHGSNLPIAAFALTGYSSVLLWRNMPSRCIGAIEPNLSLMYHRNVKVFDIFAARLILEGAGATISFVVLTIALFTMGLVQLPENVLQIVGGWLLLAWFGTSLAIFLGSLAQETELVEKLWHPFAYLLFPLSGAAFLVDSLPIVAQRYVLYLPMVHCVELIREGYFGSQIRAHYDIGYVVMFNSVLGLLGIAKARKIGREVTPERSK
jgi:ABC-2 type transport system permease protein/capsular polysaccharide transport system permease protein